MTFIARYLPFLTLVVALASTSCAPSNRDGGNPPPETPAADASAENAISFKVDGKEVRTTGHNLAITKMGGALLLNITTSMHTDARTINVNLAGSTAGEYNLVKGGAGLDGKSGGLYFPDYNSPSEAYSFTTGTFNLTRVDTAARILEGSFSGSASSEDGKTVSITDGKITAGKLNHGVVDVEAMMK